MKKLVYQFAAMAMLAGLGSALPVHAEPAPAAKAQKIKLDTLKPGKLKLDNRLGYILVRIGPRATAKDKPMPVAFSRIDPETNAPFATEFVAAQGQEFASTMAVAVNTGRSFGDSSGAGVYLASAFPGRWLISVVGSTCLSMGTYAFDVKQGEITDVGLFLTGNEDGRSPAQELQASKLSEDLASFGTLMNIVMSNALYVKDANDEPALPPELQGMVRTRAALISDIKTANFCQGLIGRAASLPPIGHQPPMTSAAAVAAIAKINPPDLAKRVAEDRAKKEAATK